MACTLGKYCLLRERAFLCLSYCPCQCFKSRGKWGNGRYNLPQYGARNCFNVSLRFYAAVSQVVLTARKSFRRASVTWMACWRGELNYRSRCCMITSIIVLACACVYVQWGSKVVPLITDTTTVTTVSLPLSLCLMSRISLFQPRKAH